jgi:hypothetical protein
LCSLLSSSDLSHVVWCVANATPLVKGQRPQPNITLSYISPATPLPKVIGTSLLLAYLALSSHF